MGNTGQKVYADGQSSSTPEADATSELGDRTALEKRSRETVQHRVKKHKVVILGASGVGKSAILCRLLKNTFEAPQSADLATGDVRVNFGVKSIQSRDYPSVLLELWDIPGRSRASQAILARYLKDADVALLVYSVSDVSSWDTLQSAYETLLTTFPSTHALEVGIPVAIIANKIDCIEGSSSESSSGIQFEKILLTRANDWSLRRRVPHIPVSAKDGTLITKIIRHLTTTLAERDDPPDGKLVSSLSGTPAGGKGATTPDSSTVRKFDPGAYRLSEAAESRMKELRELLIKTPTDYAPLVEAADIYIGSLQIREATQCLQLVHDAGALTTPELVLKLARCHLTLFIASGHQYHGEQSENMYQQIVLSKSDLYKDLVTVGIEYGDLLRLRGKCFDAVDWLNAANNRGERYAKANDVHLKLAEGLVQTNNVKKALEILARLRQLPPYPLTLVDVELIIGKVKENEDLTANQAKLMNAYKYAYKESPISKTATSEEAWLKDPTTWIGTAHRLTSLGCFWFAAEFFQAALDSSLYQEMKMNSSSPAEVGQSQTGTVGILLDTIRVSHMLGKTEQTERLQATLSAKFGALAVVREFIASHNRALHGEDTSRFQDAIRAALHASSPSSLITISSR